MHRVVITGAGISLASGIPTFRGTDPGAVWADGVLERGTRAYFMQHPVERWRFYLERFAAFADAPVDVAVVEVPPPDGDAVRGPPDAEARPDRPRPVQPGGHLRPNDTNLKGIPFSYLQVFVFFHIRLDQPSPTVGFVDASGIVAGRRHFGLPAGDLLG